MKNSVKNIIVLFMTVSAVSLSSCDFLNVSDYFEETMKYDSVFHNKRNVERYLWATANYFPDEGNIFEFSYTPGTFATDEAFSLTNDYPGISYAMGEVTPTAGSMHTWRNLYVIIRKANTIVARMDEAVDLTAIDKMELLGYTYFLRAYAYYHLLMKYGPVVILGDDVLENNEEAAYYDMPRATYDESAEYVCTELEKAAQYLPQKEMISLNDFGRPSREAAWGLIARVRLIHASPLYNGKTAAHTYFGNWKRSVDDKHYVAQEHDERRWALAALAAKRVIETDKFSLHTVARMPDTRPLPVNVSDPDFHNNFPNGAEGIDPFRSYSDMFTGEALSVRNPEFVWGRMSAAVTASTRFSFPVAAMGGWNCAGVTQKIVDAYEMEDGRTTADPSSDYPYSASGFMGGSGRTFSGYQLKNSVSNMYVNREMRFYASIGFSECYWPCNSVSGSNTAGMKEMTLTYYLTGNAGKQTNNNNPLNYPITGYVIKKYIHVDDAWGGDGAQRIDKPFPIVRYAEILLSYAEALNNLTTTHTITDEEGEVHTLFRDPAEIKKYFNQVRYRAGLPGLTPEELASADAVQKRIEHERMVEFLFEDRRYFDVRRWGIYETSEKEPITGMNTEADRTGGYYNVMPVNHSRARNRMIDKKLVLFPLLLDEVRKASKLDQNPGWQQ
ncbi:MAG: RagB/SusD family nutrient uptake outer membrane protein [Bacteroidales bacterium]|nr:RagB/SusD family nutrient uptake outer membrane protein [Bacteroidales bacterium]